ncbi:hypothetical protein ACIQRS_07540 [Streptomyces termitum]|uniref:Uncharacterized protein n=1 Tax=Streptomyces termitum TaxID=67368 RepID=A0A918W425_9ACTN|nr:hypothetical protein [Streptomyces termitum]GHA65782.1 hypothetical protein GCM10010305_04500 [Streptomyces termitum]
MPIRTGWVLPQGQTRQTTRLTALGAGTPADQSASRSGILPGSADGTYRVSGLSLTGSGPMTATVHAGRALVQGLPEQGAYPVDLSGDTVLTFTDGNPLNPRVDLVVLRVYDHDADGLDAYGAVLEVITGQAAATPVVPETPGASLALFTVRVKAGTSAGTGGIDWNADLTDLRTTVASVGGILPVYNNAGVPGAYPGQYQDDDVTHHLQRWSGTAWVAYPKEIGGVAPQNALSVGSYPGQYREHNGVLQRWNGTSWAAYQPPVQTESLSSGAVATTGWSVVSYEARRSRGLCTMSVVVTRTGANIPSDPDGNINDVTLCTLPAGWRPPFNLEAAVADGYGDGSAMIASSGLITLRTWSPNGLLKVERNVRVSATYILP